MWREIRNPEFLLGALKSYLMLTGKAPYDREFLGFWWTEILPAHAPIPPFPTEAALASSKIRVLSIAPLIGEAIRRIADESSVSSLFD